MNLKVAHICTSKISYRILDYKLKELTNLGYEVHLISSNDSKIDESVIIEAKIKQHYIEMEREISILKDLKSIFLMYRLLKKEKFDIVHTHTAKAGIIGRIAAYISRTPVIIHTSHGVPFYDGMPKFKYFIYKGFEKVGGMLSTYVGSQNLEDFEILKEVVPPQKLYYEGNGVDMGSINKKNQNITLDTLKKLRQSLGIKSDDIIIFMGARFESVKNHRLLVDVLEQLSIKTDKSFKCILAGDGPLRREIKKIIDEKCLDSTFIFLGHTAEIEKYIQLADIVTLTSIKEGIPRIIMESMVLEKPIVATNVKGTKELVINFKTGLLSAIDEMDEMVNNFIILLDDKEKRIKMGQMGKERIENEFTEKVVAKRISEIYKRAYTANYRNSKS